MFGGHQRVLQMLASLLAFGRLLPLKNVLHKWGLVRGEPLPTAAKIEKRVSVSKENWREACSRLGHGLPSSVLRVGSA